MIGLVGEMRKNQTTFPRWATHTRTRTRAYALHDGAGLGDALLGDRLAKVLGLGHLERDLGGEHARVEGALAARLETSLHRGPDAVGRARDLDHKGHRGGRGSSVNSNVGHFEVVGLGGGSRSARIPERKEKEIGGGEQASRPNIKKRQ